MIREKIPEMVILEDDADVPPALSYATTLNHIRKELPHDYDLCHLYVQPSKLKLARTKELLHLPNKFFINKGHKTLGMVAYLISLSGAANLLKEFEVISQLVDIQINRLIQRSSFGTGKTRRDGRHLFPKISNDYKFFSVKDNIVNLHHPNLSTNVQMSGKYVPHDPCISIDTLSKVK